jgi:NADPH:quinone reductase-like Zn-dependent oxidoreductase
MVFSGEVESVGSKVESYQVGDPVFGCDFDHLRFGMYAEYVCIPADGLMAPKPSNLTHLEAAALPYGGLLALHFLQKGDIGPGRQVLIYGASGAIGTAAVQLAHSQGARVTGVCGPTNIEMVRSLGAERVIDYTRENFADSGDQYDFILNAVGKAKAQLNPAASLAPNGRHVTVDDGRPKVGVEQLLQLKGLAERGAILPVIDRCYPLEAIVEAHRYVEAGHKKGNVAIAVGPS